MPDTPALYDSGLVVPRTADYIARIREEYETATGLSPSWDDDLIIGIFSAIMAQLLGEQSEAVQAVYDAWDENNATGVQLSNLARIVGVTRRVATRAQVTLTLTGDVGTVIADDRLVEGGGTADNARWRLTESVTIPASGTIDVVAEAVEPGRTVALAGEIDTIVTPVPGWDTVTNASAASPGLDTETDDELRVRRRRSLQQGAGSGINAIRAAILNLEFVEASAVIDNPDNETSVVEGISLPGGSFLVILLPSPLTTAQQEEVLQAIYDNAPVGIAIAGTDVTGTVTGADGFAKSVAFDYAVDLSITIVVRIEVDIGYVVADVEPELVALIDDYVASLTIGEPLRRLTIYSLADQVEGIVAVSEMALNGNLTDDVDATAVQRIVSGGIEILGPGESI